MHFKFTDYYQAKVDIRSNKVSKFNVEDFELEWRAKDTNDPEGPYAWKSIGLVCL